MYLAKILLSLQVWNLFASSEQIMRAADCKPFVKKGLCPFLTSCPRPLYPVGYRGCDEATSALDPKTTRQILELIQDINRKLGITVVVITHQMSVVKEICTHVAILDDGEVVEDGLVSAVFSAPRSQAARHLVFPGGADAAVSDPSQERRIRLIFRSAQTTAIPMVARLAAEESIYANVISASTQKLSEEVYGSMLLGIPNSQFDRAWQFFRTIPNLQAEEVSVDVQ